MTTTTVQNVNKLVTKLQQKQGNYRREIAILDNRMLEMGEEQVKYNQEITALQIDIDVILEVHAKLKGEQNGK